MIVATVIWNDGKIKNQLDLMKKELKTDLGNGNFIFVGSSCDLFANDIPKKWILKDIIPLLSVW